MRSGFIIGSGDVFCGALIYRLQRRKSRESTVIGKDTSSTTHLLVVWRIESMKLYANVLLVVHDKGFYWEKDDLEELYRRNIIQLRLYPVSVIETWLLDDNTALITTFKIINEDRILDIAIFEAVRYNGARMPVHIDPER
jgi:hypothetical protein